jgi:hypothetical protein
MARCASASCSSPRWVQRTALMAKPSCRHSPQTIRSATGALPRRGKARPYGAASSMPPEVGGDLPFFPVQRSWKGPVFGSDFAPPYVKPNQ